MILKGLSSQTVGGYSSCSKSRSEGKEDQKNREDFHLLVQSPKPGVSMMLLERRVTTCVYLLTRARQTNGFC